MLRMKLRSVLLVLLGAACMLLLDHVILVHRPSRALTAEVRGHSVVRAGQTPGDARVTISSASYGSKASRVDESDLTNAGQLAESLRLRPERSKIVQWMGDRWVHLQHLCEGQFQFEAATLRTSFGSTPIFIHDIKDDKHVSGHLKRFGMWDTQNVNAVVEQLKKDPSLGFIDIGAQLGTHTLVASLLGRNVLAVDPLQANVLRLCKSLRAGSFSNNVTVVFNALSDSRRQISFILDEGNLGGTRITAGGAALNATTVRRGDSVHTVLLDDLLPLVTFSTAFVKLDVETHELEVIKGGRRFFKGVNVTGMLMEWMFHKKHGQELKELMLSLGFKPFHSHNKSPLVDKGHDTWPDDVLWLK